jgi:hypothetical protein
MNERLSSAQCQRRHVSRATFARRRDRLECGSAVKFLKQNGLRVVAGDGIAQHYTLTIPLTGIYLNPSLGLTNATI